MPKLCFLISFFISFFIFWVAPLRADEIEFKHMKKVQQCQLCHISRSNLKLKLLTGEGVASKESHKICAQCHGLVLRDWEQGSHGKKVESWQKDGVKLNCVKCHNPHSPRFPQMKALPAPPRPKLGIEKEKRNEN